MSVKRKKILGVCGDSFMAQVTNPTKGRGKHFVDILSKKLGCDVVTFARGGCSNTVIRLQIEELMNYNLTYLIIGLTSADRIDLPFNDNSGDNYFMDLENSKFKKENGVYNFFYDPEYLSSKNTKFKLIRPTLRSDSFNNLIIGGGIESNKVTAEERKSTIEYFTHLYDYKWKTQQESWIISDILTDLNEKEINYTVINEMLDQEIITKRSKDTVGIGDDLNPWKYTSHTDNSFHLTDEDSVHLAELWYNKIKDFF